jgi:uncharacterized membrane protein
MNIIKLLLPAVLACVCNSSANTLWKLRFNKNPINFGSFDAVFKTVFNFNIIFGIMLYFLSMILFFYLLSNFKLSIVIPITGLTYVLNLLMAYMVFHEKISTFQLLGIVLVLAGILMVSYSSSSVQ